MPLGWRPETECHRLLRGRRGPHQRGQAQQGAVFFFFFFFFLKKKGGGGKNFFLARGGSPQRGPTAPCCAPLATLGEGLADHEVGGGLHGRGRPLGEPHAAGPRGWAARCPVPVDLQVELPERPPAAIEATAYFVVGEALTNVAKHSKARGRSACGWTRRGPILAVEITDDGVGGRGRAPLRRPGRSRPTGSGRSRAPCAWPARPAARRRCWRSPVRVVIVEDSVLRKGLGRILAEYGDEVVATLGTADEPVLTVTRDRTGHRLSPTCACRRRTPTRACGLASFTCACNGRARPVLVLAAPPRPARQRTR